MPPKSLYHPIATDDARSKLSTDFARAAFDRLRPLGGQWRIHDAEIAGKRSLKLALHLAVCKPDGTCKRNLEFGIDSGSFDDSVVAQEKMLHKEAADPGTIIITVNHDHTKNRHTYDAAANTYHPYATPLPPRRQGCCGQGCSGCLWDAAPGVRRR